MDTTIHSTADSQQSLPCVAIVLATYNGARFLREQIQSIQEQSWNQWTLFIRDDGSSDESLLIINSFLLSDPRIRLLANRDHLGCCGSYGILLEMAISRGADYVLLADQDDVWTPDKIWTELQEMQAAEMQYGTATPLLVHSDLSVVDTNLHLIHRSFMRFCRIRHIRTCPLRCLLTQNFVTGCTIMTNRALVALALPFPPDIVVHDWWLAMCAASAGEIRFVPAPTVMYRQHDCNTIGAPRVKRGVFYHFRHRAANLRVIISGIVQARRLLTRLNDRSLSRSRRFETVQLFCRAFSDEVSRTLRPVILLWIGVRRQGVVKHLGWLFEVTLLSRAAVRDEAISQKP